MATETTNLKLNKPDKTDFYNIDLANDNMDKIDKAIGEKANKTDIPTKLPANGGNADTVGIETVTADTTIASLMQKVEVGKSKKFQYTNENSYGEDLPSDYPGIMLDAKAIFRPIITVNRITAGLMYLEIISPNQSTGVPKTITGYYNGTFYWNEELSMTNVANNLTTNQEGYVLDARQGKALSSRIDTLNNNLDKNLAWGEWTTLTLENGWTGKLEYRKNALGFVALRGNITPGIKDFATLIATLPVGCRPYNFMNISAFTATGYAVQGLAMNYDGAIKIYNPAVSDANLTGLTFISTTYYASL